MGDDNPYDELPSIPERGMPLHQINESDLAELERVIPQWQEHLDYVMAQTPACAPRLRTQIERVKSIMSNVRWDYGPHSGIEVIPAGGG